jgi:MSHA biogenesis protein MshM
MGALEESEVGAYVTHRMAVAGCTGRPLLSPSGLRLLHRASRGVPRVINVLMHKALLLAYGEGTWFVDRRHLRIAASDTPAAAPLGPWWWPWAPSAPRANQAT